MPIRNLRILQIMFCIGLRRIPMRTIQTKVYCTQSANFWIMCFLNIIKNTILQQYTIWTGICFRIIYPNIVQHEKNLMEIIPEKLQSEIRELHFVFLVKCCVIIIKRKCDFYIDINLYIQNFVGMETKHSNAIYISFMWNISVMTIMSYCIWAELCHWIWQIEF